MMEGCGCLPGRTCGNIQALMLVWQWLLVGFPSHAGHWAWQALGVPICKPHVPAPAFLTPSLQEPVLLHLASSLCCITLLSSLKLLN